MHVTQKSKLKQSVSVATTNSRNELTEFQNNLLDYVNITDADCIRRALCRARKSIKKNKHRADGFWIDGYYSHIHFEFNKDVANGCMEMIIHSDGKFPTKDETRQIRVHICDFTQLENFVKEWGEYLRKVGAVTDNNG